MKHLIPSPKALAVGILGGLAAIWIANRVPFIANLVSKKAPSA